MATAGALLRVDAQIQLGGSLQATSGLKQRQLPSARCQLDGQGRAYVGNFGFDILSGEPAKPGSVILVQPDGRTSVAAQGLKGPNGSVVTPDGRLVAAESFARRLASFPVNADGSLGEQPTEIRLEGSPDGICLDTEGGIWVARFDKNRFDRVLDGKVVETIETPGRHAVASQLGGADGRTLFCQPMKVR